MLIFRRSKVSDLPYSSFPLLLCQLLSAVVCYSCFLALASGNDSDVFLLFALCLLVINIVICIFVHLIQQYYRTPHEIIAAEKQRDIARYSVAILPRYACPTGRDSHTMARYQEILQRNRSHGQNGALYRRRRVLP